MKNYVSFEEICYHKENFKSTKLKLIPGVIYKSGNQGNLSGEILSKLMRVGNTGGMRSKNNINKKTAYVVLNITHENNSWDDFVDYKKKEVIYYGDNAIASRLNDTKHKGNQKLKYLFDNIGNPEKQFPLFLFERDNDCVNYDFKYIGLVIPSDSIDGLEIVREKKGENFVENYKSKLILTQDEVDFRWINDLIDGVQPLDSVYCPIQWKKIIQNYKKDDYINKLIIDGQENWLQESVVKNEIEGKKQKVYTTKYERNSKIRKKAIEIHGTKCEICGFDFEKMYGEVGKGFIEVHHIKPLSESAEEIEVNPKTDLICVCSNCHRMLHRRRDAVMSVNDLIELVRSK